MHVLYKHVASTFLNTVSTRVLFPATPHSLNLARIKKMFLCMVHVLMHEHKHGGCDSKNVGTDDKYVKVSKYLIN